jgi:hypothetical protein
MFRTTIFFPTSGSKSKPSKKATEAGGKLSAIDTLLQVEYLSVEVGDGIPTGS